MTPALRPYQHDVLVRQHAAAKQHRRILVVLATGLGKTEVALANIASAIQRGFRVVYIAHREELITQPAERLAKRGIPHGILKAGYPEELRKPVQVASVQTLAARRHLLPRLGEGKLLVYVDEAHRVAAASYREVLAAWPNAWLVGQTATPYRLDGQGLGDAFDEVIEGIQPADAFAQGWLVEPAVYAAREPDLKGVRKQAGEYAVGELEKRMAAVTGDIVPTWLRLARGLPTVCFAVSRDHSRSIVESFTAAGIRAAHIDGETNRDERRQVLERLAAGRLDVVSNVDLLTEGWDGASYARPGQTYVPLQALILARPTASMGLHFQMVGRLTRPGKPRAVVLDHAGNTRRHGFLRDHHTFGLDGTVGGLPVKARVPPQMRRCPACAAVFPPQVSRCGECGAGLAKPREVGKRAGDMELLDQPAKGRRAATPAEKLKALAELLQEAERKSYKRGWVYHRFEARFHHKPAPVMMSAALAAVGQQPLPQRSI